MLTPAEARRALVLVTDAAVRTVAKISLSGDPKQVRADLLDTVPDIIGYYSDGSSALAADFYDDSRERAGARGRFVAEPVVLDRAEKIRTGIAWAAQALADGTGDTPDRLAKVVQLEVARPNRDTIVTNRRRDPQAVGWRRVASGNGCKFCAMLAGRGAVYRTDTARFAAHSHCHCTAQPVFATDDYGEEASAMQYVASSRRTTQAQRDKLRAYLNKNFPDHRG